MVRHDSVTDSTAPYLRAGGPVQASPASCPAGAALPAENQIACLDALAAEMIARGWAACITTPPGRPVRLFVQDPDDPAMSGYIAASLGDASGDWWYWFDWAERIAPAAIPATAAEAIASRLRRPADPS
jgi:hypothetical protein